MLLTPCSFPLCIHRSTPVECLHTLFLGAYKYLFRDLMGKISPNEKKQISAYIEDFPTSGFNYRLNKNAPK